MRQGGFTLIELLLVVAIIGIISSVTFMRTDLVRSDAQVTAAAQQIINSAKKARQQSISVAEFRGVYPSYGLHFDISDGDRGSYLIYANCIPDDNKSGIVDHYDNFAYNEQTHDDCNDVMDGYHGHNAATVESVDLQNGVFIHKIETHIVEEEPFETNTISINYLRPEPTVWITVDKDGSDGIIPAGYVKIILRDKTEVYEKEIIFYTSVLVETRLRRLSE